MAAVATAVVVTASPHLTRPLRYIGRWVIGVGAVATIALGTATPLGVLAASAVGVAAGAVVHLLRGSPGGRIAPSCHCEERSEEAISIRQGRARDCFAALAMTAGIRR